MPFSLCTLVPKAAYQDLKGELQQRMSDRTMSAATAGAGIDLGAAAAAAAKAQGGGRQGPGGAKRAGERRLGQKVISFEGARLSVNDGKLKLLDGLTYAFSRGERVGVVGRNGAGKTSFLRALVGETPLTDGRRIVGDTVRVGYYDQRGLQTAGNERQKVLDYVVSKVKLGVDEAGKLGVDDLRLLEDFGAGAVGVAAKGAAPGSS